MQNNNVLNCISNIYDAHKDKISCVIELHNKLIATGSYDNTIKVWNIYESICKKTIHVKKEVLSLLEFEPNMILCGTTSTSQSNINLYDINNPYNTPKYSFIGHSMNVNSIVKCDSNHFASASNDSSIIIWNYSLKQKEVQLYENEGCILSLIKLLDGRLCSGSQKHTIKIWNWKTSNCDSQVKNAHEKWVYSLCQLNNGYIVSGSNDRTLKFWDQIEENRRPFKTIRGFENSIRSICQISNNYLAVGCFKGIIKIIDLNSYQCVQEINEHTGHVTGLLKNTNGDLISISTDNTIKIWKINN